MDNFQIFKNMVDKTEAEMRSISKPSDWWRSRERINRELGKIIHHTKIGVFPQNINQSDIQKAM